MSRRCFTVEQLITILAEVEAIVNTCPLTYVYDEFDLGITLSPRHFLMSHFDPSLQKMLMMMSFVVLRTQQCLYSILGERGSDN